MRVLLDTHFLLWIVLESARLDAYPWLDDYRPWGVSPVSLLEIQFLGEIGRVEVRQPQFLDALTADPRFDVDEPSFLGVIRRALDSDWTRDPFDRLLAAHSTARRVPLCTVDRVLLREHDLVVHELRD
jgi:PIN domain nuclease of toxin-antitoxin system